MLVTEDEAKTKRCQESFGPGTDDWVVVPANRMCIGSACMAWRWGEAQQYERGTPLEEGRIPATPGWEKDGEPETELTHDRGFIRFQRWRRPLPGRRGFCGKAARITHE